MSSETLVIIAQRALLSNGDLRPAIVEVDTQTGTISCIREFNDGLGDDIRSLPNVMELDPEDVLLPGLME